jgi:L-asparaginase
MQKKIHFIITGGTIDKVYDPVSQITRMAPRIDHPALPQKRDQPGAARSLLRNPLHGRQQRDHRSRCAKKSCTRSPTSKENWVIITHGTDTMSVTAEFLKDHLPPTHGRTIISHRLHDSAARIHAQRRRLQSRLRHQFALEHLDPGIYMAMHAQIFPAGDVLKDRATARFEFKGL